MQIEVNREKNSAPRALLLLRVVFIVVAGLAVASVARAEVPSTISYQGRLATPAGSPVADGTYSIAFRIYDDSTGGNLFWEEVKSVTTKNGSFSVQLGETNPLDQNTFSISNLYLAIQVGADPESAPRSKLNVVPYATLVGTLDGAWGGMVVGDIYATGQVSGSSSNGSGGYFQSFKSTPANQYGLVGRFSASGSLDGSGVYGYSRPADNYGVGGEFEGGYAGVYGYVYPTGNTDLTYGGVLGNAIATAPQQEAHLYGVLANASDALENTGVFGGASGSAGSLAGNYYGLSGSATGTGAQAINYGVYARAEGGWANYGIYAEGNTRAGFFLGDVQVFGSLSKLGGSFKIDHPLDPANKYLQHSFVESPDMMNIYNGNITLDNDGKATVTMPEWFEALNRDFRYQLTAIGAPGPNLYIAQKMTNNQFSIAGGSAGMEVSWQVTGVRHDAWAEANRIQVEVPKSADKIGTYMFPELFGKPQSMGETYEMTKRAADAMRQAVQTRERMAAKRVVEKSTE
ncbi:MAG: hypothetical protein IT585_07770 [candidate division Zixibacteria bacterium]|nr:hypothetical protein [candidate division Zixibacteria bacterium]